MNDTDRVWTELLSRALAQPAYTDRTGRACHELTDAYASFSASDADGPLRRVRTLGWYYPSEEELRSIILDRDDQHLYTFGRTVHEQIPKVVEMLRQSPRTRRAHLQLADLQATDPSDEHVPCLISAHFSSDDALHITVHARSIDLLVGLPANIYQAKALLEHVASLLKAQPGRVSFFINSAHVFSDYAEQLQSVLHKP